MRTDFEMPNWHKNAERPYDPLLTDNGLQQERKTAIFLKGLHISHLFSSPFYRAVQTANEIAKKIHLKIKVEHGFSEWMIPEWFSHRPKLLNQEQLSRGFTNLDMNYHSFVYPEFPEPAGEKKIHERMKYALDIIIGHFEGTLVIVGHGATIHETGKIFLGSPEKMNAGLCAVNYLKRKQGYWKLDYAYNNHLKTKDSNFDERLN